MVQVPILAELLKAGAHVGHKTSKHHPKMDPFIFTSRHDVHVLNMEETQKKLEGALAFLKELALARKTVVFVGTKEPIKDLVKKYAQECGMPYVVRRWLGGTITNFAIIAKLMKRLKDLRGQRDSGELQKYTKKEQHDFAGEILELEEKVGGIEDLTAVPDALVIIDLIHEKTARREAVRKNISVVALCDSNINPDGISYFIPSSDDSRQTVELMLSLFSKAIKEGREGTIVAAMPDVGEPKAVEESVTPQEPIVAGGADLK